MAKFGKQDYDFTRQRKTDSTEATYRVPPNKGLDWNIQAEAECI
jgi:hypothetical protein